MFFDDNFYPYEEISDFLLKKLLKMFKPVLKWGTKYNQSRIGFDIETSSFFDHGQKKAIMYCWQMCINGTCFYGRAWTEWVELMDRLKAIIGDEVLTIYVHNLGYEFQFFRKWIHVDSVFARERHKPFEVVSGNIRFRDSLVLSGYSLEHVAKNLNKYKIRKNKDDIDYRKLRHSGTPLTEQELSYCKNDVMIVAAFVDETIERNKRICDIPMTNTGYVRRYMRELCLPDEEPYVKQQYINTMQEMTLSYKQMLQWQRAFQGGFTHASAFNAGRVVYNVSSVDLSSAYPSAIVGGYYPTGVGREVTPKSISEFYDCLQKYCCVFDLKLTGLTPIEHCETPLSVSKCTHCKNVVENNGRVVTADEVCTTVTEIDFKILLKFYSWDHMSVRNLVVYQRGRLPKPIIQGVLKLYGDKTSLKGVADKEVEYIHSKGMLNSTYGMMVTNLMRDLVKYGEDDWIAQELSPEREQELLDDLNKSKRRFLFYPWGVYVTAHCRNTLFNAILECGDDYVYSDTDSIKLTNWDKHKAYFETVNDKIIAQNIRCCEHYKIPLGLITPKTVNRKVKPLGVWEYEGTYEKFKTLGAKRYIYQQDGKINATVAGVNKRLLSDYLTKHIDKAFDMFNEDLYLNEEICGKLCATYLDDEINGVVKDYLGTEGAYHEKSFVHLDPVPYHLSIAKQYLDFLQELKNTYQ